MFPRHLQRMPIVRFGNAYSGAHKFSALLFLIVLMTMFRINGPSAIGSVLYSSCNDGNANELIYTINQATGSATVLGSSGFPAPLDLTSDWRANSFRLWGADTDTNQLITINPTTGVALAVGSFRTASHVRSLAFDVVTGKLYGGTNLDELYAIDPTTAASTLVGPIGFGSVLALGFDLTGTLYGVADSTDSLIRINTTTGAGTMIATTSNAITDIAARPEDGVMFAIETVGDTVRKLNLTTGQTTLVGPYGAGVSFMVGLAFSPVPEPNTVASFVLGALALTSILRMRG